ncbi:MAG: sugar phosphate isomerase/epimerase [Eubacteriales bacterium]|nr:sugar phosphate isomerase/epimerase [Eubacteriales bacterium]
MKIGFNEATTIGNSTLEKDLAIGEKLGYDYIEIRTMDKLPEYLKTHTVDDLANFFKTSKIKPLAFNTLYPVTFNDAAGEQKIVDDLKYMIEVGNKIDCKIVIGVCNWDQGIKTKAEIQAETVRMYQKLADIAQPHGFKLCIEFCGAPVHTVNTFEQAMDIAVATGRDNVGVTLDCYHFHAMNSKMSALEACDVNKVFIVHLDDAEDLPVGQGSDENRLWPGDGAVDLDGILGTLAKKGYSNEISVELFRPEYYNLPAEECLTIAKQKSEAVVSRHFTLG